MGYTTSATGLENIILLMDHGCPPILVLLWELVIPQLPAGSLGLPGCCILRYPLKPDVATQYLQRCSRESARPQSQLGHWHRPLLRIPEPYPQSFTCDLYQQRLLPQQLLTQGHLLGTREQQTFLFPNPVIGLTPFSVLLQGQMLMERCLLALALSRCAGDPKRSFLPLDAKCLEIWASPSVFAPDFGSS